MWYFLFVFVGICAVIIGLYNKRKSEKFDFRLGNYDEYLDSEEAIKACVVTVFVCMLAIIIGLVMEFVL